MDFALSREQEMFRMSVRKYLDSVGQTKVARDFIKGDQQTLLRAWDGLSNLGCTAITVGESYNGAGLGPIDLVPMLEETGRSMLPGGYLETISFASPIIEQFGTKEQKEKYLPEITAGVRYVTLAWLEPQKSYHPNDIQMNAYMEGDRLVVDGVKTLVQDGDRADTFILVVRTAEGEAGEGVSLLLVDRADCDLEVRALKSFDETCRLSEITFKNVRISKNQVLGPLHQGFPILKEGLLHLNAAISAVMVGGMQRIVEMASEYAKIRIQFGQPIGRFQAIKHRIVDMKVDLEMARSLTYYANWALENHASDREAAIYGARVFASQAFIRNAGHNIQIHGGIGYTEEMDCHLYLKRARFFENYLGTLQDFEDQVALSLDW